MRFSLSAIALFTALVSAVPHQVNEVIEKRDIILHYRNAAVATPVMPGRRAADEKETDEPGHLRRALVSPVHPVRRAPQPTPTDMKRHEPQQQQEEEKEPTMIEEEEEVAPVNVVENVAVEEGSVGEDEENASGTEKRQVFEMPHVFKRVRIPPLAFTTTTNSQKKKKDIFCTDMTC